MAASSSSQVVPAQSPQVFINFRGELRNTFVSHLVVALKQAEINCYIDSHEIRSEDKHILLKRIQESQIALCIFSVKYVESGWCLDELVKIMDQVEKDKLKMIPIFFGVKPEDVGGLKNIVAEKLYKEGRHSRPNMALWEKALMSAPDKMGLTLESSSNNEAKLIRKIVSAVKQLLAPPVSRQIVLAQDISQLSSGGSPSSERPSFDVVMNQLNEMINFECPETQIIGIVGMPGIGKTALAENFFNKGKDNFVFKENICGIRGMSEGEERDNWLQNTLLGGQPLNDEAKIFKKKIFLVLDDVSNKNQVDFLFKNRKWIQKGSKIIITTRDKSSIAALVHHIYVVPGLNDTEAYKLFKHHAFSDEVSGTVGSFPTLTKKFVDYAGGNPRALEELGKELCGKEEAHWEERLVTLPDYCTPIILNELKISYNTLTENQKDAFLDIACFFRSEEEDYVKCLLDQQVSLSGDGAVKDLAEKFLICISAGRIEMHNLLCAFGKKLGSSEDNMSGKRMFDRGEITSTLLSKEVTNPKKKVRGIILDTNKAEHGIPVDSNRFVDIFNPLYLRYLKIYDSICPHNCKVNTPDGLDFAFQQIRYLHWQNFKLPELPADFNPKNLIDLRLPYSKEIQRVWKAFKDVPRLKWVDLSYSIKLTDLSALSKAYNLQRLNLEGCTMLDKLPEGMKNMERLVFLNLRGCVELCSLPRKLKLISLKTLILSGCTKFNNFELISRNLEFLHLDGTAIARLPPAIQNFPKLVLLNLRNCKSLGSLPANLYMLKALEEVILSGCSEIKSFPEIKENMEKMQILLLDGTSIEEVPKMLLDCGNNFMAICRFFYQGVFQRPPRPNGLSMLRRLCLSRNDRISSLESCITQLYHLRWIDLRYCTSLRALLTLPPNLEYLNAHGCISLKTVASPLALLMPTEQVSSSFIFTNCEKLEQVAKNEIICYAHKKSQLLSDALNRQNKGIACETLVATCFPGSVVPAWFNHRASGAVLEPELPPYLSDNRFVGIALCTVVSFQDYAIQNNNFKVKCICEINNEETSSSFFNFHIGDLSEPYDDKQQSTVKSAHVFIGFTSWLNINQCQEVVPTKASIRFEVTDGTCEAAKYEVVKCGFSLVCESDNGSWDATQMSRESDHVSNANASSTVSESGNGSRRDTNVVVSPGREEGNQGAMSSILSFLRERNLRLFA